MPAPSMIDWDLAVSAASRIAGPGPVITRSEADAVVAELRADADRSTGLVRDFTGLVATERSAPVLVVDRTGDTPALWRAGGLLAALRGVCQGVTVVVIPDLRPAQDPQEGTR